MEKPRVIIYARVSSEEQVDNTSLDNQIRCCKELCLKRGYEIISIFREEGASAKNINRIKLQQALDFCSHKKNRIDFFLVWKFDRFSRDVGYHHTLKALLSRNNVKVISYSEPVEDSPAGRLLENVLASIAQFDNDDRAIDFLSNLKEGYLRLDIMQQYRVNRLIFPDGLLIKNGVATTTRIASIFKVIEDLQHSKTKHGVADLPILRLSDFFKELVLAIN
jgi:hypothetical protein